MPTLPTIHLNGTSAHVLAEELRDALTALREAERAMIQAAPDPRDYYPQGEDAMRSASREHRERMEALRGIIADLEEVQEHVRIERERQTGR